MALCRTAVPRPPAGTGTPAGRSARTFACDPPQRCIRIIAADRFSGAPRILRLSGIKPELLGGCTLKKYASLSRMRNDAVLNHDFFCAPINDLGAMLVHASVSDL